MMRALLGPVLVVAAALASAAAPRAAAPDSGFRTAVRGFLAALRPPSRAQASFAFDDPLRLDWHFIPRDRKGLPLGAMSDEERRAAHALLRTFLTPRGYGRALGVIELESVLRELENNPGRDPGRYFLGVFGDPAADGPWSLRFEGHHLSLNFTSDDAAAGAEAEAIAPTPFFLGANPGEVRTGARAGFKLLAPHEELARRFVKSLTDAQRKQAVIAETAPADVLFGPGKTINLGELDAESGLALAELAGEPKRCCDELAAAIGGDVAGSGPQQFRRFAWAGGLEPGQGHYWRLSGPDAVVEYDNTQNDANHVHFLWRDPKNDFAAGWLARHHREERREEAAAPKR